MVAKLWIQSLGGPFPPELGSMTPVGPSSGSAVILEGLSTEQATVTKESCEKVKADQKTSLGNKTFSREEYFPCMVRRALL